MKNPYAKTGLLMLVALLLVLGGVYVLIKNNMTTPPAPPPFVWGTYAGNDGGLDSFEAAVGKKVDIAATFVGFSEEYPSDFAQSLTPTQTMLVFWEPEGSHADVLSGKYDAAIKAFADMARADHHQIILVPFNEPNLYEPSDAPTPWGFGAPGNTAESFKQAWRHVREVFGDAPNVKWGLAFNNVAIPEDPANTISNLYPGDDVVDLVGVDGFNGYDGWQSPSEIFGTSIEELKALNKPIYIFSLASMEGDEKAQWISDFYAYMKSEPLIKGFVWFNENKEYDWRVDSDPASKQAFIEGLP
jgi:hypothetical protein